VSASVSASGGGSKFAHVFDESLPGPDALRDADDASVAAAIAGWARVEAAAAARRLAAIAELVRRRPDEDGKQAHWACDAWDFAAAEVAAAQTISHRAASAQMHQAVALRDRLPRVAALFLAGDISHRLASTVTWRTQLILEDEVLDLVDEEIAARVSRWGPLSVAKLEEAVDLIVERHDAGALRRFRCAARSRDVQIGDRQDATGTASLWGRLFATDAAVLRRRLDDMARAVCDDDPRTLGQRRADALGTLGAGGDTLACACGNTDCPAAGDDSRAAVVVIHVLAEASSVEGPPDAHLSGQPPQQRVTRDATLADALAPDPEPPGSAPRPAGVIAGGGVVPAPLLAELIRMGVPVRPLLAADALSAEPGYRPSTALQRFVRNRDLTCRFPGCDVPAERCDLDHTIPYPIGPTHPSNLKCLCRKQHLVKTFWGGPGGWRDRQLPDGTVVWTSPTGAVYVTRPAGSMYFPGWDTTTAALPPPRPDPERPDPRTVSRGPSMPTRQRTRAQQRHQSIKAERALNDAFVAERNRPPPF
jgi:hypothetical protein